MTRVACVVGKELPALAGGFCRQAVEGYQHRLSLSHFLFEAETGDRPNGSRASWCRARAARQARRQDERLAMQLSYGYAGVLIEDVRASEGLLSVVGRGSSHGLPFFESLPASRAGKRST